MNGEKDYYKQRRTLKETASEPKFNTQKHLKDEALREELQKIKEVSELVYKEGISRLLDMTRNGHNTNSMGLKSNTIDTNNTSAIKKRIKKLPKIIRDDSPISKFLGEPLNPQISPNAMNTLRLSPQLQPLFQVNNSVVRAGFKSRLGTIRGKPKLQNQDSLAIKPNLQNIRGQYLFGVCDGHGAQGHLISEYVKEQIVKSVEFLLPAEPKIEQIPKSLSSAYDQISNSLSNASIDIIFSVCTTLTIIISGNNCICANLGDCKAVLGREGEIWQALPLSSEHNLQNKKERERMIANNARIGIEENEEGGGTEKIYMGDQKVPGLDITRSIGDKIGKFIGMISIPETKSFVLQPEDKFIIIGTQGLWKYITGLEAVCIVRLSWEDNRIEKSCEDLVSEADRRWKTNENDKEDITAIVIYLNVSN